MYEIHYSNGDDTSTVATYDSAICVLADRYPDLAYGHAGDLTSGGDRTLVWSCEADRIDGDGARAVAAIRRARD